MARAATFARRLRLAIRTSVEKKPLKKRCFVFDGWMATAFVRMRLHVDIGVVGAGDDALRRRGERIFFARGVDSGKKRD